MLEIMDRKRHLYPLISSKGYKHLKVILGIFVCFDKYKYKKKRREIKRRRRLVREREREREEGEERKDEVKVRNKVYKVRS